MVKVTKNAILLMFVWALAGCDSIERNAAANKAADYLFLQGKIYTLDEQQVSDINCELQGNKGELEPLPL